VGRALEEALGSLRAGDLEPTPAPLRLLIARALPEQAGASPIASRAIRAGLGSSLVMTTISTAKAAICTRLSWNAARRRCRRRRSRRSR
jgi:hypothetical protein